MWLQALNTIGLTNLSDDQVRALENVGIESITAKPLIEAFRMMATAISCTILLGVAGMSYGIYEKSHGESISRKLYETESELIQLKVNAYLKEVELTEQYFNKTLERIYKIVASQEGHEGLQYKPIVTVVSDGPDLVLEMGYLTTGVSYYEQGDYRVEDSLLGSMTISFLKEVLRHELRFNFLGADGVSLAIVGTADNVPIARGVKYTGDLGVISKQRYFDEDQQNYKEISLFPQESILTNNDLAFLRAYSVATAITSVEGLESAALQISTKIHSPIHASVGTEFREVQVGIRIVGGLREKYEELGIDGQNLLKERARE